MFPSTECVEAGQPASTPHLHRQSFNFIQDVIFMPLLYVFFFLSGFSIGTVMGSLVIIAIRAKVSI